MAIGIPCSLATNASAHPGKWSPTNSPVAVEAIHMALLPGDGSPYHSRILVFGRTTSNTNQGAELGWSPSSPDTESCADWPYPNLATLLSGPAWNPEPFLHCAGHAQLATGPGLLIAGGEEHGDPWGTPDALAFIPGSGTSPGAWSVRRDMQQARFYGSVTALRDGRMLAAGGARYVHMWHFGGRVGGNPPTSGNGYLLHRFGRGTKSVWDDPATTEELNPGDRPSPREGHTALAFVLQPDPPAVALFGGKDGDGVTTDNDVHLLRRDNPSTLAADYSYTWSRLGVSGPLLPLARSDHIATNLGGNPNQMVIYGGLNKPGSGSPATVLDDFWKLAKVGLNWQWNPVTVTGGPSPGPRYGHAAVMYNGKMYLFGGSGDAGQPPTDNVIHEFDFSTGRWRDVLPVGGVAPEPRRDHAMVVAGSWLLVYGGYSGESASSSALLKIDLAAATPEWREVPTAGPSPGPRMNHTAIYDPTPTGTPRLTIFGGEPPRGSSDPAVDARIYTINPFPSAGSAMWVKGPASTHLLSGHSVTSDPQGLLHARIPEIYNPFANDWSPQTNSGWFPAAGLIGEYPVQFLVPGTSIPGGGGRVLRVGQDPRTHYLDLPATGLAGSWQYLPNADNSSLVPQLLPLTGVQYRPGKIMILGGGGPVPLNDDRALTFDATTIGSSNWVPRVGMASRINADILMLPNGTVMVFGASCPQIWDPSANNGNGSWTRTDLPGLHPCELDVETEPREYHSTGMLLPDGRVLRGGSEYQNHNLQIYCPPYLFNADGSLAARPEISSSAASVVYGESFLIGKRVTDQISSVCLIRPGAVTHSFDQNGRYVPLTFEVLPDGTGLRALAPVSGSVAPPGDYLLFILNTNGVPAIARWIHLGNCAVVPCDSDSPPQVTDLSADIVGPNEVWLLWTAPGDERSPVSGELDLRYAAASNMTNHIYATATAIPDEPAVAPAGTAMSYIVTGLTECTTYSFGLKTRDRVDPVPSSPLNNWAPLSNVVTVPTSCGGLGGGFSARRTGGGAEALGSAPLAGPEGGEPTVGLAGPASAQLAGALGLAPGGGLLVAETRRTGTGGWQVVLYSATDIEGMDNADAGFFVSQVPEAGGSWRTLGRFRPSSEAGPLGLCALRPGGRLVLPAGWGLDRVVTGLRSGGEDYALALATHSRLGDLGDRLVASDSTLVLAPGDAITLDYEHNSAALREAASWYLLVRPVTITSEAQTLRRLPAAPLPGRFALHQARPNPAAGTTVIPFDLPRPSAVRIEVFDLLGRRVRVVADGDYPAGEHTVSWDGRQDDGSAARSGVYLYRMTAGTFRAKQTVVLLGQ